MYLSKILEWMKQSPSKEGEEGPWNDFDLLVKVMKVVQKDDHNYSLRIKDISKDSWNLTISSLRHQIPKEGEIVWVRSASLDTSSEGKNLVLPLHANILKFLADAKVVKDMSE